MDIMPISRDQFNSRNTSVDKHFMKRRLVEKRKEEWKKMLKGEEDVPRSIDYRANTKNKVKREVVAATAQRLSDNSHAAIREMRSARLSAIHTAQPKEPKSQSAREMRLARLKQKSATSPPQIQHKSSLKKGIRVEKKPKDQEQVTSSIREMRLAQGKAPVAKSYTSSTPVLRIPKTTTTATASRSKSSPPVQSLRPKSSTPIRKVKQVKAEQEEEDDDSGGCNFVNTDGLMSGGCNGFGKRNDDDNNGGGGGCNGFVNDKDLKGGCNAGKTSMNIQDIGCDMNMLKQFAQIFTGGDDDVPGADLVSRGSSEDSATMYVKKYGYDF